MAPGDGKDASRPPPPAARPALPGGAEEYVRDSIEASLGLVVPERSLRAKLAASEDLRRRLQDRVLLRDESAMNAEGIRRCVEEKERAMEMMTPVHSSVDTAAAAVVEPVPASSILSTVVVLWKCKCSCPVGSNRGRPAVHTGARGFQEQLFLPDGCDHRNCCFGFGGPFRVVFLFSWSIYSVLDTDARCVLRRVMDLRHVLPTSARLNQGFRVRVMGFAEGANIIFVKSVGAGIFTVELQSLKVRKACDDSVDHLVPLVTFYTRMPRGRGNHQNLLVSKPSEEAGGEERGEGEKTIHQLFNTLESICLNHDDIRRVPGHGEVALPVVACLTSMDVRTKLRR